MTSLAKWVVGLALCTLTSINEGMAQYLTGVDRASFIAGTVNGCMRGYGTEGTDQMPRPLFEQYCRCYADGLADRLSMKELRDENPAIVKPVIQAEGRRCYQAMKDEAIRNYLRRN